ncbi:MAG: hypothetical protein JWM56_875 [Candidatus Peribacteria bacterium]|nr:hypothetical protein [Candidatus Peribacteria bacterium]
MREVLHTISLEDGDFLKKDHTLEGRSVLPDNANWSVTKRTLCGGRQEGVICFDLINGPLRITVSPTRGFGIISASYNGVELAWKSPIKEVVNPAYINLESRGGLGWLEGFSEWMCRCGLEWSGHPGMDEYIDNTGKKEQMQLTLHGKVANIPGKNTMLRIERDTRGQIFLVIAGLVEERVFHGPKLDLQAEIHTELGTHTFTIQDTVTNKSSQPQEMQMLYHCNFGDPLLSENTKFIAAIKKADPFNSRAAEGMHTMTGFEPPTPGFIEQVYNIHLHADANGKTAVMLANEHAKQAVSMDFSINELPCFTLWKNTDAPEDGYVTGLEPGTSFASNRSKQRKEGLVPVLAAGESRTMNVSITPMDTVEQIEATKERIHALVPVDKPASQAL